MGRKLTVAYPNMQTITGFSPYFCCDLPAGYLSVPRPDCLHQCVVYEDVLLLRLHKVVPLSTHVAEEAEDVEATGGADLERRDSVSLPNMNGY